MTSPGACPVLDPARSRFAADVARHAVASLHEELVTHSKPGLVGPADGGAHDDMDAGTFLRSLFALRGFFGEAARAGEDGLPFETLRVLGVRAEARMLRATGGVNTHRGAIFALGLLAAAAGALRAAGRPLGGDALGRAVRDRFGHGLAERLPPAPDSHGAAVTRRYGAGGAREEAARGFPNVFRVALPALSRARLRGAGRGAAAVQALHELVATVSDTNLLHRAGPDGLAFAQGAARAFLAAGGVFRPGWERRAGEVHRAFVLRRLSPGGSADLLAAALFVERLQAAERAG